MQELLSGKYSKLIVTVINAAIIAAQVFGGSRGAQWVTLVASIGTALGVYAVPNIGGQK